jgi:hypothetical protein
MEIKVITATEINIKLSLKLKDLTADIKDCISDEMYFFKPG